MSCSEFRKRVFTLSGGALLLVAACGVSDREVTPKGTAGSAGFGADGGLGGSGGGGTGGSDGGSAGDGGALSCTPACSDPTPVCDNGRCVACESGSAKCDGDAPVVCTAGQWQIQPACSGDKPVCTNGVCAGARGSGSLGTVRDGVLAPATGAVRLVDHGFEIMPRTCATAGAGSVCVRGRITP
jgi:hypothetical protein